MQEHGTFIRVHHSFAINLMADGRSVAVSRKSFKDAKEQFLDYLEMQE